jgi:methionyl-tRNA synthetase
MISFDDFKKVELRVGQIVDAVPVEGSIKLLRLTVDFGEETYRTVVSGIAQAVDLSTCIGSQKIFITNLEPRMIMGFESQAMILAAKDEEGLTIAQLGRDVPSGTLLS